MQARTGVLDTRALWRLTMEHSPVGRALVAPDDLAIDLDLMRRVACSPAGEVSASSAPGEGTNVRIVLAR